MGERLPTEEERRMGDLIRLHWPGGVIPEFKPCAFYRASLDQIVVLTRDCSFTERPVGEVLTLMEANYPEVGERVVVGFVIECARFYCILSGLMREDRVDLKDILHSLRRDNLRFRESNYRASDIDVARAVLCDLETTHLQLT